MTILTNNSYPYIEAMGEKEVVDMRKFEELFFKIFDSNPIGMIISNLETKNLQYVNEIFLTSFGYAKSEVKPDLILCDNQMPDGDGFEVLNTVKNDPKISSIPFIFLTSSAEKTGTETIQGVFADGFIRKHLMQNNC